MHIEYKFICKITVRLDFHHVIEFFYSLHSLIFFNWALQTQANYDSRGRVSICEKHP